MDDSSNDFRHLVEEGAKNAPNLRALGICDHFTCTQKSGSVCSNIE